MSNLKSEISNLASNSQITELLNRPLEQRIREFRYRCAQSVIFGLPVLALQWFGPRLGGAEASRWIWLLQAILAGWIVYIAAAGMLFEGLMARSLTTLPDLLVAIFAIGMYVISLIARFFT